MQLDSRATKKSALWIVFLFATMVAATSSRANTIPSPTLSKNCAGCHGTDGYSSEPMPIIAGLSDTYLRQVMRQYKSGERPSTIMGRLTKGYTDSELDGMAAYFASQIWRSPTQEVDASMVSRGKKIHQEKCETCHKNNGRYQDESTPRIAGQWRRYLEIVMQEYAREDRKMPDYFMTVIARTLSPKDISALAHFYASEK
jgi:sulfide dehydrogenase cytochrome subunit